VRNFILMTRTNIRWLIVICLGFSLIVTIGWVRYALSQERRRDEALAKKLITEFHEQYNSHEPDDSSEYSYLIVERMRRERIQLGEFLAVKQCSVKRVAEPPWLEAVCSSSFKNGNVEEFFIMHHAADDSHLLTYSVKSDKQEFSSIP